MATRVSQYGALVTSYSTPDLNFFNYYSRLRSLAPEYRAVVMLSTRVSTSCSMIRVWHRGANSRTVFSYLDEAAGEEGLCACITNKHHSPVLRPMKPVM